MTSIVLIDFHLHFTSLIMIKISVALFWIITENTISAYRKLLNSKNFLQLTCLEFALNT